MDHRRNASHCGRFALICGGNESATGKGDKIMKTKLFGLALAASAVTIAQANPVSVHRGGGSVHGGAGGFHGGAVAHGAPAAHAPMRPGGVSSFHRAPARTYGSRPVYSGQRYSSFGMRSSPSSAYRRPYIYSSRGSFTRSGPYTVATIPQGNRIAPFANHRNPAVTNMWNQRNTGTPVPEWKQSSKCEQFSEWKQSPKWKQSSSW